MNPDDLDPDRFFTCHGASGARTIARMKKTKKTTKRSTKLSLKKESVRKLAAPDLSDVAGGARTKYNCDTVTFPLCCRSL
jgi:hypothetical protein